MPISKELVRAVRGRVAGDPGVSPRLLADELGASEAQVITALPVAMRTRARLQDFCAIWEEARAVPGSRLIRARDVGAGQEAGQRVDRPEQPPCREDMVGSIWFMASTGGREPAVRFLDREGRLLFSVRLPGQEEDRAFAGLRGRHGVSPSPKIRCKGCPHCTCRKEDRPAA